MANKDDVDKPVVESGRAGSQDKGLLTNAARAIGSAIGKVSSTLHIAEAQPIAPAARKKAAAKKARKTPAPKKATKKALAPAKKAAKRSKS